MDNSRVVIQSYGVLRVEAMKSTFKHPVTGTCRGVNVHLVRRTEVGRFTGMLLYQNFYDMPYYEKIF